MYSLAREKRGRKYKTYILNTAAESYVGTLPELAVIAHRKQSVLQDAFYDDRQFKDGLNKNIKYCIDLFED